MESGLMLRRIARSLRSRKAGSYKCLGQYDAWQAQHLCHLVDQKKQKQNIKEEKKKTKKNKFKDEQNFLLLSFNF